VTVQPSKELVEVGCSGADLADVHDVGRTVGAGVGHRDRLFVDVQADEKNGRLCQG
jgi:hypothetical protein